jgi:hypothetical protein
MLRPAFNLLVLILFCSHARWQRSGHDPHTGHVRNTQSFVQVNIFEFLPSCFLASFYLLLPVICLHNFVYVASPKSFSLNSGSFTYGMVPYPLCTKEYEPLQCWYWICKVFSQIFPYLSFGEPACSFVFLFDGFIYCLTLPWLIFLGVPVPMVPVVPYRVYIWQLPYLRISHLEFKSCTLIYMQMSRVSTHKMCRGFVRDGTKTQYDDKPAIVNNRTEWTVRNKVM